MLNIFKYAQKYGLKPSLFKSMVMLSLFSVISICVDAQPNLKAFKTQQASINTRGMKVLGGWAIINLGVSGLGAHSKKGADKHFHIMNASWGAVNLVIAGIGYFAERKNVKDTSFNANNLRSVLKAQSSIEKILLFNAGLDVAYVVGGFYLKERALRFQNSHNIRYEKLTSYGRSFIVQGGFLFVFDLVHYFLHRFHRKNKMPGLFNAFRFKGNGVVFSF